VGDGMQDRRLGDLVEDHSLHLDGCLAAVQAEGGEQVPGNRLPFAVGVGGEQQPVAFFESLADRLDVPLALGEYRLLRRKIMTHVNRPLLARQGADMAVGSQDLVPRAEELFDGLGFGGGFNDDERLCHECRAGK